MPASQNIRYIPAVDHLRAYAAMLVLLYHCVHLISYQQLWHGPFAFDHWPSAGGNPFMAVIYEGHTGVALFMVLSGFIFTFGAAGREIEYGQFLRNRILRIYPLLIALIFVGLGAFPQKFTFLGFVQTVLPLQNLPGSLDLGVYGGMFWTIAIEFQFYLVFPFLHRMLTRQGAGLLLGMILLLVVARASATDLGANPREFYSSILGRLDQFLIGMIAATQARKYSEGSSRPITTLWVGAAGIVAALCGFNRLGGYPAMGAWKILWPTLEAALWAAVIVGYLSAMRGQENSAFSRGLAGIGTLSYSMYLIHALIIKLVMDHRLLLDLPNWPHLSALLNGALIVLPMTLAVSFLTYRIIERPFLEMRHRYMLPPPVATPPEKVTC